MSEKFKKFPANAPPTPRAEPEFDAPPAPMAWAELPLPRRRLKELLVQCFNSDTFACSYLPEQRERLQILQIKDASTAPWGWSVLAREGFRRSGSTLYRPNCPDCKACQSLRVCAAEFAPTRSQRRAWETFAPRLLARALPLHASAEHFALYSRYQRTRHTGSTMDGMGPREYRSFIAQSPVRSVLIEFRDAPSAAPDAHAQPRPKVPFSVLGDQGENAAVDAQNAGALRMVSLIDMTEDGISAVYTFFDPEFVAGLGTYGVLWQIGLARRLQLPFVYLGYWIEAVQNMRYKQNFYPHQILNNNEWVQQDVSSSKSLCRNWDFPGHDCDRLNF